MSSKDKTSSVWSIYSEETGTPFAACNLCSSKIKRGKEWPGIIFKRKYLLFISLATIFSYAHGKKWKFPAKSGRQKIYPRNTRFRSGKIRLTGNKIEIRLFPVRQRNPGTGRFLNSIGLCHVSCVHRLAWYQQQVSTNCRSKILKFVFCQKINQDFGNMK